LAAIGAAQAQSSVTLYGTLDAGVQSFSHSALTALNAKGSSYSTQTASGASYTAFNDSTIASSVWGLRGTEDLGGGMKAAFNVEGDVSTANGAMNAAGLFRRAANASVSGSFGTVSAGLKMSPFIAASFGLAPGASNSSTTVSAIAGGYAHFFTTNAITYNTPNLGMFSGSLQWSPNGQTAGQLGGSSNYVTGSVSFTPMTGLTIIAAAEQLGKAGYGNNSTIASGNTSLFGATYSIGQFSIGAQSIKAMNNGTVAAYDGVTTSSAAGTVAKYTQTTQVSGTYAVNSALSLAANYVQNDAGGHGATKNTLTDVVANYSLSKSTSVYGRVGQVSNGNGSIGNISPAFFNYAYFSGSTGSTSTSVYGVGLIKSF